MRPLPSVEELKSLVDYNPETGEMRWKISINPRAPKGRLCATKTALRSLSFLYKRRRIYVHRAAWAIVHGKWPEKGIDHINCDAFDNSIKNLREATQAQNLYNRRLKPNSSGARNVRRVSEGGQWKVKIRVNGIIYGSLHPTLEEADQEARRLRSELHGEFARH